MVAVEAGPMMRRVSVLRAWYRSSVTEAVCRVRPAPDDHLVLSGSWFHSQACPRVSVVNSSTPVWGAMRRGGRGTLGNGYSAPQTSFTLTSTGQPSSQVMGART